MSNQLEKVYYGILIEEEEDLSLMHLCQICNHSPEDIIEWVEDGILEPMGQSRPEWKFSFRTVERVWRLKRLKKDFDLNLSGLGLAMHLLDRIEELEERLQRISK